MIRLMLGRIQHAHERLQLLNTLKDDEPMANSSVPLLKDVAKAANVSLASASRILRGDQEPYDDETCQRVLEAARRLGWRRNLLVTGMQTGRTKTVGVLLPPIDSYWVSVLSGIHDALSAADYLPMIAWSGKLDDRTGFEESDVEGLKQINRMLDRRVDGLIMWPTYSLAYYHHFPEFVDRRVPVAVIDHYSTVTDSVETDEEQATAVVAEHLLGLGHRRIACLSRHETPPQAFAIRRRSSFEAAVQKCPDARVKSWHLNEQGSNGVEIARQLLADELRPTAVFAVSDYEARVVHRAAVELGRKIPQQLSLVGFADLDFAATMDPALTTIRQRPYEIGRLAAELIMDRIASELDDGDQPTTIKVDAELVVRASTAPPANSC